MYYSYYRSTYPSPSGHDVTGENNTLEVVANPFGVGLFSEDVGLDVTDVATQSGCTRQYRKQKIVNVTSVSESGSQKWLRRDTSL